MSLFEDISISVVILSAIFYVSKNYYTFYRNYIKYLYLLIYTFLIFSLGWNLSLINSENRQSRNYRMEIFNDCIYKFYNNFGYLVFR